tara:strand:- start:2795 stop:3208 length:414 start_codon:yes stop_codon:yes gene_type:complete
MFINYAEYSYFKQLNATDKVLYLFETWDATVARADGLDLNSVFDLIRESLESNNHMTTNDREAAPETDHVDVMIDDENIMIESNSLRATRHIIYKFMESGYILRRNTKMEKIFKKDKVTRYLRVFKIIDQIATICLN